MDWERMSRAERDAAYNNATAVAGSAEHIKRWAEASAALRAKRPQHIGLPYGTAERNRWDLFPANDPGAPCLVFIHGGYWQMRAREDFSTIAEGLLAHGWAAALPGYTLAPDASLTTIVTELRASLDWLGEHGPQHGIAGPVVLSGWSAGGHLAAVLLDHPRVTAGLAISGIYELGPIRDTYLDAKLRLTDDEIATLSPQRLPAVAKPLAVAYGSAELPALVRQSRHFHGYRAAAHAPGPLVPAAGGDHFTVLETLRRPDGLLTRTAQALL